LNLLKYFNKKKESSKDVAKERLKLVLVHDRSDLSPQLLEAMKADIISVISKYVEINESEMDIKMTRSNGSDRASQTSELVANIPIVNVKEAAIKS
jgi:cell division topological specificity factor